MVYDVINFSGDLKHMQSFCFGRIDIQREPSTSSSFGGSDYNRSHAKLQHLMDLLCIWKSCMFKHKR